MPVHNTQIYPSPRILFSFISLHKQTDLGILYQEQRTMQSICVYPDNNNKKKKRTPNKCNVVAQLSSAKSSDRIQKNEKKKDMANSKYQFWGRTYSRFTHDNEELLYNLIYYVMCALCSYSRYIPTARDSPIAVYCDKNWESDKKKILKCRETKKRTTLLTACPFVCHHHHTPCRSYTQNALITTPKTIAGNFFFSERSKRKQRQMKERRHTH